MLKQKKLRMAEDLTYWERECRNKLWPLVKKARDAGKKTKWMGAAVIIDGEKFAIQDGKPARAEKSSWADLAM